MGTVEIKKLEKSEKVDSTLTLEKSASPFLPHCLSPGWGSQLPNSVQEVFPNPNPPLQCWLGGDLEKNEVSNFSQLLSFVPLLSRVAFSPSYLSSPSRKIAVENKEKQQILRKS